jgi:hypothetical protein
MFHPNAGMFLPPPFQPPNTMVHYGANSASFSAGGGSSRSRYLPFTTVTSLLDTLAQRGRPYDNFINGKLLVTDSAILEGAFNVLKSRTDKAAFDYYNQWLTSQGISYSLSSAAGQQRKRTYKRKNARVLTRKRRVA